MSIQVRYFASLRERMGREGDRIEAEEGLTVAQIWDRVAGGESLPRNALSAVNMEYVDLDQTVADGDEVAFFPPVTGGQGAARRRGR